MKATTLTRDVMNGLVESVWGSDRPNAVTYSSLSVLGTYDTGTRTFTALKKVKVAFFANMRNFQSNMNGMSLEYNGTRVSFTASQAQGPTEAANAPIYWTGVMNPGETLVNSDFGVLGGASWTGWSLLAEAYPKDL